MAITLEELRNLFPEDEDPLSDKLPQVKWLKTDQEILEALSEDDFLPGNDSTHPSSSGHQYETAYNEDSNRTEWHLLVRLLKRYQRMRSFVGELESAEKQPPKAGEYLLYLFLSRTEREVLIGDLTEEYPGLVTKFGLRLAKVYFYKQVVWSIWPLVRKTVVKWSAFGWVAELIRRISS